MENLTKKTENLTKKIGTDYEEKSVGSYTLMKKAEKEAREKAEEQQIQDLFLDYLKFYDVNYPKSTHDHEWKEPKIKLEMGKKEFLKELDELDEKQLYGALNTLEYGRKEHASVDVKEYYNYLYAKARINKRIPGANALEKLKALQEKESILLKEKKTLQDQIDKERNEFLKKQLQPKIEPKIEPKKEGPKTETSEFICKVCGKPFKNAAGLGMHSKTHEK